MRSAGVMPLRTMPRAVYYGAVAAVASVTMCVGSAGVAAQGTQSSGLTGAVMDRTNAVLPGVTMTVVSPSLIGGARSTKTDEAGVYRFPALVAGIYELTAEHRGFTAMKRNGIKLPIGTTLTIDLALEVAPVAETTTVPADWSALDVKSPTASIQLETDLLQNLPTVRQQPEGINLIPGVNENVAFGGTQDSNALMIDGLGVSGTKFGSSSQMLFNYNWIEEMHVVALGANAEYGEFTGLTANSIIRSGSNRFSGLGEHWTTRPSWVASNTASLPADLRKQFAFQQIVTRWDSSAQLGGPIARDRLWFFGGAQYAGGDDRLEESFGVADRERNAKAIVKMTAAPFATVRLEGFYEHDWSRIDGAVIGAPGPPDTLANERAPGSSWSARLTWVRSHRTLLELWHSGYRSLYSLEPMAPNSRAGPATHLDLVTGLTSGNAPFYLRGFGQPLTAGLSLTRYADRVFGRQHALKLGVEYQRTTALDEFGFPAGQWYLDYEGHPFLVFLYDGSADRTASRRATVFAQDTWTVSDRLTLHPGLRFSVNRGSVPERGTVFATNPLSPRLGLAWDVVRDHKTVVRAHYGRYHDALLSGQFQFMDSRGERNPFITALVLPSDEFVELDRFEGSKNFAIDDRVTHSYVDQYFVGVERELVGGISLQAHYIRRNFANFMAFVDTGSVYQEVPARDPGPDGRIGTDDDGAIFTVFNKTNPGHEFRLLTNPSEAFRRYSALQIIGRNRYSRGWQLLAGHTWSRTEGNIDQRLGNNAGQFDAAYDGVFADPNRKIHAAGRTSFDFTHEVKVEGTYRLPLWGGVNLGGVYRYHSGLAWGRRANIPGLWQGFETVRIEPRGTRRLPAIGDLDLRVEKTLRLRRTTATLGIFADVFNVTNQGAPNSRYNFAVADVSGQNFGQPGTWLAPRSLRAGARLMF